MANREIAYRVADQIERSTTFSMSEQFREDGQPSCIAGHLLADTGDTVRNRQPNTTDIGKLMNRLGIDEVTAAMLCMPLLPEAHVLASPGDRDYISKERAAAQLRRVGEGKTPNWSLPVVDGKVVERA